MFKSVIIASVVASAIAFMPSTRMATKSAISMNSDMVGALPPVGFFDPLGLSKDLKPAELKKYREAELKHGRVCMIAFLGIVVGENFNPFFGKSNYPFFDIGSQTIFLKPF